ncbi:MULTISPECIES: HD domain-containing phosphohydrolase [unclassified Paenibacillus]|uniref:HD-GYP domain-containing protein n=1 Tax=unclassified Paenibacillus TaxID=185978 RepID=UPI001AE40660|nr:MULTISPECIES: HD domain-containing phosphohydrolase [unclassified Paenibacillus]MBP1157533.1 HD-GYP domain-containing protein (c-di-GMP phosphodiesterase class II) [Paenibacillus sp. PvP091]MBP1171730.1 HD-GYP domain-containing protein (c-di-GMP phosphodiesterase class II) [Paenibacillus sp. PvR098]MBP2438111.1 HD-GYP domain-containing protein (c-di-GMP phosphodiesterase class II) [Paenibacillus sp. PvP052]
MRYVHVDNVEPGQYLGRTIFSANGAVLLSEGVQLTVYMITTLKRIGVTMVYIKDMQFEDVEIPELVSEETKQLVMKRMGETFNSIRSGKDFNTKQVFGSIDNLLEEIMQNKEVLVQLSDIRTEDNEMYVHAINVCMVSSLMGINLGLSTTQLRELAVGALMHDIGKLDKITDDESPDTKKHHTWRGFEALKAKRELNLLIAHVAFQHHETMDGQGLPRRLKGEEIHLYAKITAVANTYDNLLFDLSEGRRLLPHEACERMMVLAGEKLDREIVIQFLRIVSVYPTGSSVRLSTRETGVVVGQHRGLPGRPIVRIVKGTAEDLEVKEIDLAKHMTVFIESVLI